MFTPTSRIVVAGGRGVCNPQSSSLLFELADFLAADVATTRGGVESGFFKLSQMVGLSGKRIEPQLYLAFGVSGSDFHTIGIRRAGMVFAVNIDNEAPIFDQAGIRIVGDAERVLSELCHEMERCPDLKAAACSEEGTKRVILFLREFEKRFVNF